jgi:hypothetical protein
MREGRVSIESSLAIWRAELLIICVGVGVSRWGKKGKRDGTYYDEESEN